MKNELLAPNGKPSNLNSEQYKLVRSKSFINWFGDWINDPSNASKIVDENGEPQICYHGTNSDFDNFSEEAERKGYSRNGFFFTPNFIQAESYTFRGFSNLENIKNGNGYELNANIIPVFLRLKKPLIVDAKKNSFRDIGAEKYTYSKDFETNPKDLKVQFIDWDGLWYVRDSKLGGTHFKFKTEKEAKEKVLELKKGKRNIPITLEFTNTRNGKHLNEYIYDLMQLDNDGAVFLNIVDFGSAINEAYGTSEIGETIWVKNANQIKSAIGNNGDYNINNNNISFNYGGMTENTTPDYLRMFLGK
jgi:hypothetical protein